MDLGVPELLIIAFIVLLLFGSKKLPGAAKSVGQSLKIFKDETKGLRDDNEPIPVTPVPARALPATPVNAAPAESVAARPATPHLPDA